MIYKEVLSGIDEDEFKLAGDRTLDRALKIDEISGSEWREAKICFNGLSTVVDNIYTPPGIDLPIDRVANLRLGVNRLNLAIMEYFESQINQLDPEPEASVTYRWLQELERKKMSEIAKRHLHHELDRRQFAGDPGFSDLSPEEIGTFEEYPAFMGFSELYEERLNDHYADKGGAINEQKILEISEGMMLGALVIREAVELVEFKAEFAPQAIF